MSEESDEYILTSFVAAILLTARLTVSEHVMSSRDEKLAAVTEAREIIQLARAQP